VALHFCEISGPRKQYQSLTGRIGATTVKDQLEVAKQQHCRVVVSEDLFAAATVALGSENLDAATYSSLTVPIRGRTGALQIRVRK
jgi:hypothetical protein